ncbi:MAG: DUF4446 family protein [Patescibacteria group bacterium]
MEISQDIIIYILLGLNIILVLWISRLEMKTRDIKILKNTKSIVDNFKEIGKALDEITTFDEEIKNKIIKIEEKNKDNIQNLEILRFNPFKDQGIGGDQSFALTLLDKKGNGAILSSLYGREKVSVFAKPIKDWKSEYELSEEEKHVLNKFKK